MLLSVGVTLKKCKMKKKRLISRIHQQRQEKKVKNDIVAILIRIDSFF